jgi:hypothetical protein
MDRITKHYKEVCALHPELKDEISMYYYLAMQEIDDGESPDNEYDLFVSSVDELINEKC